MKLYYCKYPDGRQNFGDYLNPWLWGQLLPGAIDDRDEITLIGIGTLINDSLPRRTSKAKKRIIFGTGAGFPGSGYTSMPRIDNSYTIYCLRGPLSAEALEVSQDLAITDGAILVRRLFDYQNQPKKYRFSYMPHYNFAGVGWANVCQELGFGYIDPSRPVEEILLAIAQTEVLLSEAMHGAILADAFRVPWVPIITDPSILEFKWQDWCLSVGVEYKSVPMKRLYHPRGATGGWSQADDRGNVLLKPLRQVQDWLRQKEATGAFTKIVKTVSPTLSSDAQIENLTVKMEQKLEEFKDDLASGKFVVHSTI